MQEDHSDIQQQPVEMAAQQQEENPREHKTLNHHTLYYTFIQRYFTSYQTKTQYIHQHSNGYIYRQERLFVIRVRTDVLPEKAVQIKNVLNVQLVKGKKKRGGTKVHRNTVIVQIVCQNGDTVPVYALIDGVILERNQKLTPQILHRPEGYVAVINSGKKFRADPEHFQQILLPHQE